MALSANMNNQSELYESMRKGIIDTRYTLGSVIKDEVIVPDDFNFIDVCTKDTENKHYLLSDEVNGKSFVKISDSDEKKIMCTNSTIHQVNNDKKVSEYSELCSNCGITTDESMNQTKLCKATKSFTCSTCSFKCCSRNNLEHHTEKDHKISMEYAVKLDLKDKERFKSMNNYSNERSLPRFSKIDRKKDIELYCVKCHATSSPRILHKQQTCGLCNAHAIYQCKICKKRYTHVNSLCRHLKNECINIEPQYKCSQCDYIGKQKVHLQTHMKRMHETKICTGSDEIFNDIYSLRKSKLHKCSNKLMHECYCCSYKTMLKSQLNQHFRLVHDSKYRCSQCGKRYIYSKAFKNHQKNGCGF